MKQITLFIMVLASCMLFVSCHKEIQNAKQENHNADTNIAVIENNASGVDTTGTVRMVVYENTNSSIDTFKTFINGYGKVDKKIYTKNSSSLRISYTAEFYWLTSNLLNLKLQKISFDNLGKLLSLENHNNYYELNDNGMIVIENPDPYHSISIRYFDNGQLKYTYVPGGCHSSDYSVSDNNTTTIYEDWGCGKLPTYHPPSHLYEYSDLKNICGINQIDIPDDLEYALNCPAILLKEFLGKPNQNLISHIVLRYWDGRAKNYDSKGTYDKLLKYSYEFENDGNIKTVILLDSNNNIIRKELYSSYTIRRD